MHGTVAAPDGRLGDWHASADHVLTAGVQWRLEELADYQPTLNRTEDQRFEDLGVLVQSDATLSDRFGLVSSARVDLHSELDDPEFSARLGGKYAPTDRFRLRASLGNGFRALEVFSEDFHLTNIGGALQTIANAPDLTAEHSLTTTPLGPEWQLSERWTVEANGFYTGLSDTFAVESADDPATQDALEFERRNGGRSRVYGAEFNLNCASGCESDADNSARPVARNHGRRTAWPGGCQRAGWPYGAGRGMQDVRAPRASFLRTRQHRSFLPILVVRPERAVQINPGLQRAQVVGL